MFYKRLEAQKRFSFFFNAASLAGAFGGLLASAIGKMDGLRSYSAWRWIFILEGILTCILSAAAFFLVSDFPEDAKWLSANERAFVISRLKADQGNSGLETPITWQGVVETFSDWKMIPGALMYFGPAVSAYGEFQGSPNLYKYIICLSFPLAHVPSKGLAYFIPSIIATYGYAPITAQLYSVIPWAAAIGLSMTVAYLSDKLRNRFYFILAGLCLAMSGNLVLLVVHDRRRQHGVGLAGLILYTMGVICILPIIICWFTMNLKGHRNRAVGTAWQISIGNLAGMVTPFAFPAADKPSYHRGYSLGLAGLCLAGAAALAYLAGCLRENKRRPEDRLVL